MGGVRHIVAALSALGFSVQYAPTLGISWSELPRYVAKSINLALCYVGFSVSPSGREAVSAGRAAFLSCAYDVVTDWRDFDPHYQAVYNGLLRATVDGRLADLAMSLYSQEVEGTVRNDGLERGVVAFEFITRLMGSFDHYAAHFDAGEIGTMSQIADDILDLEDDIQSGDLNCLTTARRGEHLELFLATCDEAQMARLFPHGRVIQVVFGRARLRAQELLSQWRTEADLGSDVLATPAVLSSRKNAQIPHTSHTAA